MTRTEAVEASLGTDQEKTVPRVALLGNPNTGKSTLFNALCGTRQVVGNYPGVTVEKKVGRLKFHHQAVELIDLPGIYSLNTRSPDEAIALNVLMGRIEHMKRPDLVLFIMDATNLKRNLLLFSQVVELGLPLVVALTMTDLLEGRGISLEAAKLEETLGAPVVPVLGRDRARLDELRRTLLHALKEPALPRKPAMLLPESLEKAVARVKEHLVESPRYGF